MKQNDLVVNGDSATADEESGSQVTEYSKTEAELNALREVCATTVFDVKTPSGMKQATNLRAKVRTLRTGVEKLRKETKAPVLALGKLIDSEAERITNELLVLEKPIDDLIKAEEKRKKDEQQAEVNRVATVRAFFDNAKQVLIDCISKDSVFIKAKGDEFSLIAIDEGVFLTKFSEANKIKDETLDMLGEMILDAEKRENSAKELAEKTKQLNEAGSGNNELHLVELKGATCNVIARHATTEACADAGIEYSEFEEIKHDMVTVPRDEYESADDFAELRKAFPRCTDCDCNHKRGGNPNCDDSYHVSIPRTEYERLLWLTTPQPIETAPVLDDILIKDDGGWNECVFEYGRWVKSCNYEPVVNPTYWQPLPNTPMPKPITAKPKLEDADDALGR